MGARNGVSDVEYGLLWPRIVGGSLNKRRTIHMDMDRYGWVFILLFLPYRRADYPCQVTIMTSIWYSSPAECSLEIPRRGLFLQVRSSASFFGVTSISANLSHRRVVQMELTIRDDQFESKLKRRMLPSGWPFMSSSSEFTWVYLVDSPKYI